jgi:hypothetical protein
MRRRAVLAAGAALVLTLAGGRPAVAGGDWNEAGISWHAYDKGLETAKQEKKPVCLVVFTEWCPHCTNYSKVFHDPKIVEKAKQFVMIRVDKDKSPDISRKYAPDGEYIPRTFFLSSSGELAADIHEFREKFLYFYDENKPASLLIGMNQALKKFN